MIGVGPFEVLAADESFDTLIEAIERQGEVPRVAPGGLEPEARGTKHASPYEGERPGARCPARSLANAQIASDTRSASDSDAFRSTRSGDTQLASDRSRDERLPVLLEEGELALDSKRRLDNGLLNLIESRRLLLL